ncbi:MOSC domain-containing protein [Photobacterium alginatilyticum]|uniref:MOSC domain-containing protein n=1 Tax=Photobacterium alginatilyticum TaxID=1775171 RepID=UPI00406986FF
MTQKYPLSGVYCGKVASRYGMKTAIDKSAVEVDIYLSEQGLEGDECADHKHHGGAERALHQYPAEHYRYWSNKYQSDSEWQAPGMGENLSSEGMTEETVCIGDRYQWGEALIEVSQPRSPCFKLSKRWGVEKFAVDMQDISRCGWLYRVIRPGKVNLKEPLILVERVDNAMSVREVCEYYFGDPLNQEGLNKLLQQDRLSQSWMSKVELRLETRKVENWNFRLLGHA